MKRFLLIITVVCLAAFLAVPAFAGEDLPGSGDMSADYSSLRLDGASWVRNESTGTWSLERLPYCTAPVSDAQTLSIYVPGAYLDEDGNLTDQEVNGYSAVTAPVIYAINMAGYDEASPVASGPASGVVSSYLDSGYVVVTPGSRGKATVDEEGKFIGKGAACIADLKAGLRFIRFNDDILPGNTDCIVVTGNSAGGAMSVLVAVSGNNPAFDPLLEEIGAVMTETDDVYAAQAYCAAQTMDYSDMLYEWLYTGQTEYTGVGTPFSDPVPGVLDEFRQALSDDLAMSYIDLINSLGLSSPDGQELTLEGLRSGNYYDYVLQVLGESLASYLKWTFSVPGTEDQLLIDTEAAQAYVDELNGTDPWITVEFTVDGADGDNGAYASGVTCSLSGIDAYTAAMLPRAGGCPSSDTFDMVEFPNQIFGTETADRAHFSTTIANLFAENDYSGLEGYDEEIVNAYADAEDRADAVYLLNAMNFIGSSDTASFIRIRHGSSDNIVCPFVNMNLAIALDCRTDSDVDFAFVWGQPHGEAELNNEDLYDWIETVCRSGKTSDPEE